MNTPQPQTTYRAQYEITDQEQPISALAGEARQRITEDILQLGMVAGPIGEPVLIDVDGSPWLQIEAPVRSAGQLLESVGIQA
jgi:uncharacterized protein involved in type VI secretion and phage assembly